MGLAKTRMVESLLRAEDEKRFTWVILCVLGTLHIGIPNLWYFPFVVNANLFDYGEQNIGLSKMYWEILTRRVFVLIHVYLYKHILFCTVTTAGLLLSDLLQP